SMQIFCSHEELRLQELDFEALIPKLKHAINDKTGLEEIKTIFKTLKPRLELAINDGTNFEEIKIIKDLTPDLFSNFINNHRQNYSTFLRNAINSNDSKKVQLLIDLGVNVNLGNMNIDYRRPLHEAAINNLDQIINLLIAAKATIDLPDRFNQTPLHIAVRIRCHRAIELLIAAGADTTIKDNILKQTAREYIKPDYITHMIFDRAVIQKKEKLAATKIQALARGFLTRKNLKAKESDLSIDQEVIIHPDYNDSKTTCYCS
ncbi:MAG: ankyrin repeat domain-containing protein, partial [Candidatus Dependentiae bacterium]|nr:ankyrin repeat domain-containing protein [Candidatus Dependentiae bacterium]